MVFLCFTKVPRKSTVVEKIQTLKYVIYSNIYMSETDEFHSLVQSKRLNFFNFLKSHYIK